MCSSDLTLIKDLEETFANLRKVNIKLNPAKCVFGVPSGKLLGFLVSHRGIEANPDKIKAIEEMQPRSYDPSCISHERGLSMVPVPREHPSSTANPMDLSSELMGQLPCTSPHQGPWCLFSSRDRHGGTYERA